MGVKDHMPDAKQKKATLTRNNKYRKDGHKYIRNNKSRRDVYSSDAKIKNIMAVLQERRTGVSPKTVDPGSEGHAKRYTFTYKTNFRVGESPYTNQAHHMIPESAFSDELFTSDQIKLLWMVNYNVNNEKNIIFLPEVDKDSAFHLLPSHSGNHPRYTETVFDDMTDLRTALNKVIQADPNHKNWSPPDDILKKLMDLQKKYWKYLTNCGPILINEFKKPGSSPIAGRRRNALQRTKK